MHFGKILFWVLTAQLGISGLYSDESAKPIEEPAPIEKPAEKKIAIVHRINTGQGLFSVFFTVAHYVDRYDKGELDGLQINLANEGFYYDPENGSNWWEYYMQPINMGVRVGTVEYSSDQSAHHIAYSTELSLPKERIAELAKKYYNFKPNITKEVDSFVANNFKDKFVIGLHYRGTDQYMESPRTPYEKASDAVDKYIKVNQTKDYVIFVATDEMGFIKYMQLKYPDKVVCQDCFRSTNINPVHYINDGRYKQGKEACIDCLLLSKCNVLFRTNSNLSFWSTFFNPEMPVIALSHRY
jgi:hypothetical protein